MPLSSEATAALRNEIIRINNQLDCLQKGELEYRKIRDEAEASLAHILQDRTRLSAVKAQLLTDLGATDG